MKFSQKIILLVLLFAASTRAQDIQNKKNSSKNGLIVYTNADSTSYIKATGLAQIWIRYNDNNPGSTIYGTEKKQSFDIGLRRVRYQAMSQINKKVFLYTQIGINSFNYLSARKTPVFFHDVTGEYALLKKYFTIGCGLSGWNGTSRYSSSGVGNILGLDLPVIQETTNDITDQFVRKPGVFMKGKIDGFDYRISVSNPFPVQTSLNAVAALPANEINTSYFSTRAPELMYQGYFMWQFLDQESNLLPYMTGSYLGKKRVLSLGTGFTYQGNAMWHHDETLDTISTALQEFGTDIFFDYYLNKEKQNAITAYAAYMNFDFGPNYIRNAAIMNTANGINSTGSFNGAGNAVPMYGTGDVVYVQAAYLFRHDLLKNEGTLQPYVSGSYANYERLNDPVIIYDIGINWIQDGQHSKISLDYQSRPVFNVQSNGKINETKSARRGSLTVQYQLTF